MSTDEATIATRELKPLIGTEIELDAETLVSGSCANEIRALLDERSVLVFPEVHLEPVSEMSDKVSSRG